MATLSDIYRYADDTVTVLEAEPEIPQTHFVAHATVFGTDIHYLLRGTPGDEAAKIVARVEIHPVRGSLDAYRGDDIRGGYWHQIRFDLNQTLASMV